MSVSINGTGGLTFSDSSVQSTAATGFGFKNRIINGAMVIDQRNAGASVTAVSGNYLVDRYVYFASQAGKFTAGQNLNNLSTLPVGYSNYLGFQVASAVSIGASDTFQFQQRIEGFNFADMAWGTANASAITLSFKVYSSLTGTFGGALRNSSDNRSYPFTYSIPVANTWTTAIVTIAGDTSGTWVGATSGVGVKVIFGLGEGSSNCGTAGAWASAAYSGATGQVSVVGTGSATFYITGVQLEKGSTATAYDYRPYGTELALCQRYFISYGGNIVYERFATAMNQSTTASSTMFTFPVEMRANPTFGYSSASHFALYNGTAIVAVTGFSGDSPGTKVTTVQSVVASGLTTNQMNQFIANNTTSARATWSAEL